PRAPTPTTVPRPSQPAARSCSAARRPAIPAPTITTGSAMSVSDEDRLYGADVRGLFDLVTQAVVRIGLVDELSVVVHPEDVGGGDGALAVVLTQRTVDGDLHESS